MGRVRSVSTLMFVSLLALALASCAIVDKYSSRATNYNLEAEQVLDQGVLLNVVRASERRPMQFTTLATISGSASSQTGVSFSIPFGDRVTGANVFSPSSNLTVGTQAFVVNVLDNVEFYRGLYAPIPWQIIDYYYHTRFPRLLLFNLFIDQIVVRRIDCDPNPGPNCEITLRNYPGDRDDIETFQIFVQYLAALGMKTETLKPGRWVDSGKEYDPGIYRFCFAPDDSGYLARYTGGPGRCGSNPVRPGADPKKGSKQNTIVEGPLRGVALSPELIKKLQSIEGTGHDWRNFQGKALSLSFYLRSPGSMIYYVGELLRRQIKTDRLTGAEQRVIQVMTGTKLLHKFYLASCVGDLIPSGLGPSVVPRDEPLKCENVFVADRDSGPGAFLSVEYDGHRYSIPRDEERAGRSMQVISVIRQLMALLVSAKTLPATNVISVGGQ